MTKDIIAIKQVLADDKPPLSKYKLRPKTPDNFPYDKYTLMPPEDARKIVNTLEALNNRAIQLKSLEQKYTDMRTQTIQQIQGLRQVDGFDTIQNEMAAIQEKLSVEVESTMDKAGDVLLEYNNVITTIFEQTTTKKPAVGVKNKALIEAIKKFASPKIAGQIIDDVDKTIAAAENATTTITRELASWPSPQDLRKRIKEEKPEGVEASKVAGVLDSVKNFFGDFINVLKSAWDKVSDAVSSLSNSTNAAIPLLGEIKQLAQEVGINIQASKTASMVDADSIHLALIQDYSLYNQIIGSMNALIEGGAIDELLREDLGEEIKSLVQAQFTTEFSNYIFRTKFLDVDYSAVANYFVQDDQGPQE